MYLMVETIRVQTEDDRPEWTAAREAFKNELGVCVCVCVCVRVCGEQIQDTISKVQTVAVVVYSYQ